MANTSSTIQIIFEGAVRGVRQAAAAVEAAVRSVDGQINRHQGTLDKLGKGMAKVDNVLLGLVKGFFAFGAASASIQTVVAVIGGLVTIIAELTPMALALPGIILGIGTAFGVAKLALAGFTDAVGGDVEALAKFSAEGQKTVKAVQGLAGGFQALRSAVQQEFFKGLSTEITATGNALLTLSRDHLPAVATGFNTMLKNALAAARTPVFQGRLAIIFDQTARALGIMDTALADFIRGLVGLGSVGIRYFGVLTGAINDSAAAFANWVDEGIRTGSINDQLEKAEEAFRTLGNIIGDVGVGLGNLFGAFNRGLVGGGGTLEAIERVTQAFRELTGTSETQSALQALGETVRVLGDVFRNVLGVALRELGPAITAVAPFVQELAIVIGEKMVRALEFVGPLLTSFARFLSENKEAIAPVVSAILSLITVLKVLKIALAIKTAIAGAIAAMGGLAAIGTRIASVFRFLISRTGLLGAAVLAAVGVITGAFRGFSAEADAAFNKGNFGQDILTFFDQLKSAPFQTIGAEIRASLTPPPTAAADFKKIGDSFQRDFVDVIVTAGAKIGESFQRDFIGFFAGLPAVISTGAQPVIDFFVNLPTTITTAMGDLGAAFVTKAQEIWTAFLGGLTSFFAPVLAFFSQTPYQMGFAIGAAIGEFINIAIRVWQNFLQGCVTGIAIVVAFCAQVPGMIISAISAFIGMVVTWAASAWNGARNTTVSVVAGIIAFAAGIPGRVIGAISSFIAMAIGWARSAWTGVLTTTTSIVASVLSFVQGIPGRIIAFLASLPGMLRSNSTGSWEAFKQGVITKANEVFAFVRGIPGRIISTLGNLGSLLVGAGRSIIDGLLAGIRSAVQGMYNFVSGIAAGIAARKGPITKDRVLLVPQGVAIIDGLLRGMQSAEGRLLNYAGTIAGNLADALSQGVALPDLSPALATATALGSSLNPAGAAALPLNSAQLTTALSATPPPVTYVTVKIGETELRGIVDEQVETTNREVARVVGVGTGRG